VDGSRAIPRSAHWLAEKAAPPGARRAGQAAQQHRTEELVRSHACFFGSDRSYHEGRQQFVAGSSSSIALAPCLLTSALTSLEATIAEVPW
jgi:hypothetical protein